MTSTETERSLLTVVDRIYHSIEEPELWTQVLDEIGELVGGPPDFWRLDNAIAAANPRALEAGCHSGTLLSRRDLKAIENYVSNFGELILEFLGIMFLGTIRTEKSGSMHASTGKELASQFISLGETIRAGQFVVVENLNLRAVIVALWENNQVFSAEKLQNINLLLPHLKRAARLQLKLAFDNIQPEFGSTALDRLTLGVMFIDQKARPIWLNRRAQEIANDTEKPLLRFRRALSHRLEASLSADRPDLVALGRGPGTRPLLLMAIPLPRRPGSDGSNECACSVVFISDPDRVDDPSVDALRQAFGLTYREAQVATAIANGHGLQAAADTMGIAVTTARSQLQQAFAKTSTGHQAELAALVHRTLSRIRYDLC